MVAVGLAVPLRTAIELFHTRYWRWLFQGWKLVTFLISATAMVVIAPYTGDPTWDYVDAAFMSLLAYTTAPWVVGTVYLTLRGKRSLRYGYIAFCLWLFSASWSYDLYLLIRDGYYPFTWLPNLFASSVLYVSAGLLWSLEYLPGRGVIFGFMAPDWPTESTTGSFTRIVWYALPFMILVTAMIVPFLI